MIRLLKKKSKRKDLLKVPDAEKVRLLEEIKSSLRQKECEDGLKKSYSDSKALFEEKK